MHNAAPFYIGSEIYRKPAFGFNHPLNIVRHAAVIDVLLNNAGFFGTRDMLGQQMPGRINYDLFEHYIWLDAVSPLKVAEAFLDHVAGPANKRK